MCKAVVDEFDFNWKKLEKKSICSQCDSKNMLNKFLVNLKKKLFGKMLNLLVFLMFCVPTSGLYAEIPHEVVNELPGDEELIKDKRWNRWTTSNFVICSISNSQAEYLDTNVENIKKWILTRWGFHDISFEKECRVIAVDDPILYTKFFRLAQSYVKKGKDYNVVFILLDDKPSKTVPVPLTEVCLIEFEEQHDVEFGLDRIIETLRQIENVTSSYTMPILFGQGGTIDD